MEISRYASRLSANSPILPSGRPLQRSAADSNDSGESSSVEMETANFLPLKAPLILPEEPDDARLTGGTRSLSRRLLALNIPGMSAARQVASAAVGGSFVQRPKGPKAVLTNSGMIARRA